MWKLEWIDKGGDRQQHIFADKTKMEEVMDNLENDGIDPSTFKVSNV